jgi:SAM-dependent methyltransferase
MNLLRRRLWSLLQKLSLVRRGPPARLLPFAQRCTGRILEIGGPSGIFAAKGLFPLYRNGATIDNVLFNRQTIWTGEVEASAYRPVAGVGGAQHFAEATRLEFAADGCYDALAASHVLEHVANGMAALREWRRVVRPGGLLVLAVPQGSTIFDRRRPVTSLAHFVEDEARSIGEDDLTHLPEILELHDLALDPWAGSPEAFAERSRQNLANRCLHHHVFSTASFGALLDRAGFEILELAGWMPIHVLAVVRVPLAGETPDNRRWLNGPLSSPFREP